MRTLIATPLIDGRAEREFINGLIACQGLYHAWACIEGQSHISLARDMLANEFLASDCERLVFIDGDIGFDRAHLERLLSASATLVSGAYPAKSPERPWTYRPETPPADPKSTSGAAPALQAVRDAPCGFLCVHRRVFEDRSSSNWCPSYTLRGQSLRHFFQSGVIDGHFLSEDYFFCDLARRAGHPPYVDSRIRLRHIGRAVYWRDA